MSRIVSTESVPPDSQLDYWREAVDAHFIHLEMQPNTPGPGGAFTGKIIQHAQGVIAFADVIAQGHIARRSIQSQPIGDDDIYLLLHQRHGHSFIEQDGRQVRMYPGDLVLCDSRRNYSMNMPEPFHHEVMVIPGHVMRHSLKSPERYTAVAIPNNRGAGRLFLGFISSLRDSLDELGECSAPSVASATVDLLCAALLEVPEEGRPLPRNLRSYHQQRLRAYIHEHLADPDLDVGRIAEALRLSKRHLHSLFDDQPITLTAWVWKERLDAARRALSMPANARLSIAEIAFSIGFKSSAHFSRLFQASFGMSPRDFRAFVHSSGGASGSV